MNESSGNYWLKHLGDTDNISHRKLSKNVYIHCHKFIILRILSYYESIVGVGDLMGIHNVVSGISSPKGRHELCKWVVHEKDTVVEDCSLSREAGEGGHRPWEVNRRFLFMVSLSLFFSLGNLPLLPYESTHTCNYEKPLKARCPTHS